MKRAVITGIIGQDKRLLEFMSGQDEGKKIDFEHGILSRADLIDAGSMVEAVKIAEADEIYYLAVQSFVGASFEQPIGTGEITGLGVTKVLKR
jgi:GDP-D-mannose dehydratase